MFIAEKKYCDKFLIPYISEETMFYHYEKHHVGYANTLNSLVTGTYLEKLTIYEILLKKEEITEKIYNNAAQVLNHNFYWNSLAVSTSISETLLELIKKNFQTFDFFENCYITAAMEHFGSGWSWFVYDNNLQKLSFINTKNADNPINFKNINPLLVIDLWEHAYYIDYKNDKRLYIENIVKNCLNWKFAEKNFLSNQI